MYLKLRDQQLKTVKDSACYAGDLGLIPGSGTSLGEGNGYPLQYSRLENSMVRGAQQATPWVEKSQTQLRDSHLYFFPYIFPHVKPTVVISQKSIIDTNKRKRNLKQHSRYLSKYKRKEQKKKGTKCTYKNKHNIFNKMAKRTYI